jgi:hypothetical protein
MINFPCKCGYAFELDDDQAGRELQCPRCHLLVDVPRLSDLQNLNDDGTFAFEESLVEDQMTAADLHRVFTNRTTDSQGREKDLRTKVEHLHNIGVEAPIRVAPRYDPATGELIRPMKLKEEEPLPVIALEVVDAPDDTATHLAVGAPTAIAVPPTGVRSKIPSPKPRQLGYAVGSTVHQVNFGALPLELLMPANVFVMVFMFVVYIAAFFTTSGLASYAERFLGIVQPFVLLNMPIWLVLAHLGCTLEDTGPDAIDEVPRPGRNFSLGEDIFSPLFRVVLAGLICFWPLVVLQCTLYQDNPLTLPIKLVFVLAGSCIFPAVVLTSVTGTTVLNLRPDRVLEVIRVSGGQYLISVLLFIAAGIPAVYYLAGDLIFPQQLVGPVCNSLARPSILFPALAAAVYLLHYFGWHLGLIYRAHHAEFPWLAQRFVKSEKLAAQH